MQPTPSLGVVTVTLTPLTTSTAVAATATFGVTPIAGTPTFGVTVEPPEINNVVGLSFVPAANTVRVGEVFTKEVWLNEILNAGPQEVDRAKIRVEFDPDYLRIVGLTAGDSLEALGGSFDNANGVFEFEATGEVTVGRIKLFTVALEALRVTTGLEPFGATALNPNSNETSISHQGQEIITILPIDIVRIEEGSPPPSCHLPTDLNNDGEVNVVDIMTVTSQWGQHCQYLPLVGKN